MCESLDKTAYPKESISISSSAAIGNNKTGDKADDEDKEPLLKQLSSATNKNKLNLNIWDAPIISGFVSFKEILGNNFYVAIYVLFILTITFMLAQIAMWLLGITSADMQTDQGWGPGDGKGEEYDFLAGPVFAVMSIISTLPVGYIVDKNWISREIFLSLSCFIWSASTVLTGYSTQYWQIVIYRMVSAMSTATAQPLCASIITDFFPSKIKTSAMAIFNFGIYVGFSLTFGVGNYVSQQYSWRYAWYIFGYIGGGLGIIIFCLPKYKQPIVQFQEIPNVEQQQQTATRGNLRKRHKNQSSEADIDYSSTEMTDKNTSDNLTPFESEESDIMEIEIVTFKSVIKYYVETPSLIILLIASLYRNCGGYVWGYQANIFLETVKGQSKNEIAQWMGWIAAVGGSFGCLLGGALSDRLAAKYGKGSNDTQFIQSTVTIRIWVLVIASLISGPLAAGMIFLDPPYCYWSLFTMYFFSEMWISITVTIVAELSPEYMKSTLLSIYYFVIAWAGFSPQLVTPIENLVGYQWAIFILWPGIYGSVSILFFAVIFTYKRDLRKKRALNQS